MMFLFVALICLSSAIIVSSIAHSHNHNHSHTHTGRGLDLGLPGDSECGRGMDREEEKNDPHCRYVPIVDESSPRTTIP